MSEDKIHKWRMPNGEEIEIRETPDGKFYCPVCGFLWPDEAPYYFPTTNVGEVHEYTSASFDICPCCNTEFGFDDYVASKSRVQRWNELRIEWLDRVGWTSEALKQLQDNIEVDTNELKRLAGR